MEAVQSIQSIVVILRNLQTILGNKANDPHHFFLVFPKEEEEQEEQEEQEEKFKLTSCCVMFRGKPQLMSPDEKR